MEEDVRMFDLDDVLVRFTPEGKVSVMDAIKAVSRLEHPWSLWEKLKIELQEILAHCENYAFPAEDPVPVVDSEGLQKILIALLEYNPELGWPQVME